MNESESGERYRGRNKMKQKEKPLKDIEIRILAELMKNSRRSERELANAIGIS